MKDIRDPNIFEKVILVIGIVLIIVGPALITSVYYFNPGLSWGFLQAIFLWTIMIILLIAVAVLENVKEEIRQIVKNGSHEIKLLRKNLERKRK